MTCSDRQLVGSGRNRQVCSHRGEDTWLHWALSSPCPGERAQRVRQEHRPGTRLPGVISLTWDESLNFLVLKSADT